MSSDADRAHAETLSIISHDIRAPLGVILGSLGELASPSVGALTSEQRTLLALIRRSAEKLTRLANNVSLLQQVESGRFELGLQPTDLRLLARRAADTVERAGERGKLSLDVRLADTVPLVSVDPERVLLVLANALSNALRFASAEIRMSVEAAPGGAEVVIEDDGPGVALTVLPHVFDRVARARAKGDRAPTGLGLTVIDAIVRAHGGRAAIENLSAGPGRRGARFRVFFHAVATTVSTRADEPAGPVGS
jgi:signal transduction histidine kinase